MKRKNYEKNNLKILVCYHKKYSLPQEDVFVPIHCGRDIANTVSKDGQISNGDLAWLTEHMIGDNTGDNISDINRDANEITAIYWAWKNYEELGNPDYIGLNHYRRYFKLTVKQIKKLLNKYDFIASEYKLKKNSTLYKQWLEQPFDWAEKEFLDTAIQKFKEIDPPNGEKFENFLHSNVLGLWCNMFVLPREDFFNYCNFIFPIVFEIINIPHKSRAVGMFAERLTAFWLYEASKTKKAYFAGIKNTDDKKVPVIQRKIINFNKNHIQPLIRRAKNYIKNNTKLPT